MLIGACFWRLLGRNQAQGTDHRAIVEIGLPIQIGWRLRLHWLLLAFVPSGLLLGVSQHISIDAAAAPILFDTVMEYPLALVAACFFAAAP